METSVIKGLVKTELHCHLDGSLSLEVIRQLAAMAKIALPEDDSDLKALVTAPKEAESLMDYLAAFDVIRPLLQTEEALTLAAYDVAKQAAQENVIYIEIRFAPELSMDEGLTVEQVVAAVCRGLKQAQEDFGIVAKALVCGLRQTDLDLTKSIFRDTKAANQDLVVGMDFAGNEVDYPTETMTEGIKLAQDLGYPMTFHAGEQCGCAANIAQAMALDVKRTGHTTAIFDQPEMIEEFVARGMTAEICLTSNFQTKAIQSIEDYPYLPLRKAGANISINTDNRTVSDTNLTKEYEKFVSYFNLGAADFMQHNLQAIQGAFASEEEKAQLSAKIKESYQEYLR
ncbi:adenosine deaminase [Streptococcus loxodontisalivarius]|uniref:Adenosine deaminase n=1 Tax=Streptococcus loxodontisalivarius TaxID=1349415 RepID=A0ABS2PR26_9STRE|nr:adenosine deaminase [Streptococcus loxodontisalivarius]MBM7642175.1 adenosine deaminase [Streptococcus loxodontisalivarius]